MAVLRIVLASLLLFQGSLALEDGVSLIVGAGNLECFYRPSNAKTTMDFDLQVLYGNDIGYQIRGPTGRIYSKESFIKSSNKHFELEEQGDYEICFDNSYSVVSHKVVYFDLGITDKADNDKRYENLQKDENELEGTPEVVQVMESIQRRLETISLFQSVMKAKSRRHHRIVEDQGTKVMVFSCIGCLIMICVGMLQVYVVRKLFAEKRGVRT